MKNKFLRMLITSFASISLLTGCPAQQPIPENVDVVDDYFPEDTVSREIEELDNAAITNVSDELLEEMRESTGNPNLTKEEIINLGLSEAQIRIIIELAEIFNSGTMFDTKQELTDGIYDILALIKSLTPNQLDTLVKSVTGSLFGEEADAYSVGRYSVAGLNYEEFQTYKEIIKVTNNANLNTAVNEYDSIFQNITIPEEVNRKVEERNATNKAIKIVLDYFKGMSEQKRNTLVKAVKTLVDYNIDVVYDIMDEENKKWEQYDGYDYAQIKVDGVYYSSKEKGSSILSFLTYLGKVDPIEEIKLLVGVAMGSDEAAELAKEMLEQAIYPAATISLDLYQDTETKLGRLELFQKITNLDSKDLKNLGSIFYRVADKLKGLDIKNLKVEDLVDYAEKLRGVIDSFTDEQKASIQKVGNILHINVFETFLKLVVKLDALKLATTDEQKQAIKDDIEEIVGEVRETVEDNFVKYFNMPELDNSLSIVDANGIEFEIGSSFYDFYYEYIKDTQPSKNDFYFRVTPPEGDETSPYFSYASYNTVKESYPNFEFELSVDTTKLGYAIMSATLSSGEVSKTYKTVVNVVVDKKQLKSILYDFNENERLLLIKKDSTAYHPNNGNIPLYTGSTGWHFNEWESENNGTYGYAYYVYDRNQLSFKTVNVYGLVILNKQYFSENPKIYYRANVDTQAFVVQIEEANYCNYVLTEEDYSTKGAKKCTYDGLEYDYLVASLDDAASIRHSFYLYNTNMVEGQTYEEFNGNYYSTYIFNMPDGNSQRYSKNDTYTFTNVLLKDGVLTLTFEGKQYTFLMNM